MEKRYYEAMGFTPGEAAEVLLRGVEGIRRHGWTQGTSVDDEGRMCLYGGVGYGMSQVRSRQLRINGYGIRADLPRVFHEAAPDTFPRLDSQDVVDWNDALGRVQAEVEDMMLRAAKVYCLEQDAIDAGESE